MPATTITLDLPVSRLVVQRDTNNRGKIPVVGQLPAEVAQCRLAFTPRQGGRAKTVYVDIISGMLDTNIELEGGFYDFHCQGYDAAGQVLVTADVERVGVGLVLLTYGHSVPQGDTGSAATDDRACTLDLYINGPETALPFKFRHIDKDELLGPFNRVSGWGMLADQLIQKLNVPVLIYGAAFGSSNMEGGIKVVKQIPFEHPFIKYEKRMPIYPVEAVLTRYTPVTGLHGVLVHHGVNDRTSTVNGEDIQTPTATLVERFQFLFDYFRGIANRPDLPFYVAVDSVDETKPGPAIPLVRAAQLQVIATLPNVRQGAELSRITQGPPERPDGTHLSDPEGITAYANEWNRVLTAEVLTGVPIPSPLGTLTALSRYGLVDGEHIANAGATFPLFVRITSTETYVVGRQDATASSHYGQVFTINRELLERLIYTGADAPLAKLFTDKLGGMADTSVAGTVFQRSTATTAADTLVKRPDPVNSGSPITKPSKPDLYLNAPLDLNAQLSEKNAQIIRLSEQLATSKPNWWASVLDSRYLAVAIIGLLFLVVVIVMWPRKV